MKALLEDELPAQSFGRLLLSGSPTAPVALAPRGKQVCTCFNISEPQIIAVLGQCSGTTDERLSQLQGELKCGTNCGSCLPALRTLVNQHPATQAQPA